MQQKLKDYWNTPIKFTRGDFWEYVGTGFFLFFFILHIAF